MAVEAARDCLAGGPRTGLATIAFASTTHAVRRPLERRPRRRRARSRRSGARLRRIGEPARRRSARCCRRSRRRAPARRRAGDRVGPRAVAKPGSEQESSFGHGAAALRVGAGGDLAAELLGAASLHGRLRRPLSRQRLGVRLRARRALGAGRGLPEVRAACDRGGARWGRPRPGRRDAPHRAGPRPRSRMPSQRRADSAPKSYRKTSQAPAATRAVAHPLLMLGAVLEKAAAGAVIVLASFGQGSDALVLRATGQRALPRARLPRRDRRWCFRHAVRALPCKLRPGRDRLGHARRARQSHGAVRRVAQAP